MNDELEAVGGDLEHESDDDAQITITNPDENHRVRRLNQIHETRESFTTMHHHACVKSRDKHKWTKKAAFAAVHYARQLEPLMKRSDDSPLSETVHVNGELSLERLLDQGGYNNEHWMSTAEAMRVVRVCDQWLDEHLNFDIESTNDTLNV
jgi:hypothetical protein